MNRQPGLKPLRPTPRTSSPRWTGLVSTLLVALNGLYMLLVVFGNLTDFDSNRAFVHHVLAMDTTNFGGPPGTGLDPDVMWRAVTSPALQTAAYVAVIVWESATAIVLVTATVLGIRSTPDDDPRAQQLVLVGLLMIVVLFFGGFICIGGEWFAMYRSTTWNGLDPAFRNTAIALLTLVVARPTEHTRPAAPRIAASKATDSQTLRPGTHITTGSAADPATNRPV